MAASYNRQAVKIIGELGPQFIHCHDLHTLWAGYFARRRLPGTTVVYDSHEIERHRAQAQPRPLDRWLAARYESFLIRRVDRVIVACDSAADLLVGLYGIPRPSVIRNCPDVRSRRHSATSLPEVFASLPQRSVKLLYVGGIVRHRGLEEAIAALVHLPEQYVLVLLGKGTEEYIGTLRSLAASLRVSGRLMYAGCVRSEAVGWVASHADVGLCLAQNVSLNNYFSLPNKLFEYIGAGLPVVASDFPELKKIVLGDGLGVVCPPDRPEEIAACIRRFVETGAHLSARKKAARVAPIYTWAEEKHRLLTLYPCRGGNGRDTAGTHPAGLAST
jgi:glycosyltransferase involved in cell wall biosynthesis